MPLLQLGFLSGLSGHMPASLTHLSHLAYLDLAGNMLTGALPASLPASMVDLRLSENALTGTIPSSYGAQAAKPTSNRHVSQ